MKPPTSLYHPEAQVDGLSAFNGKVVGSRPTRMTFNIYRVMEEHILFSICTPWRQAHKWEVTDGLVDFYGDMITPNEAFDRFVLEYSHMFLGVVRADISKRINKENGEYSYTWIEIERFF